MDYKKIVGKSENWPLFKESFDIPLPEEKGVAKNIRWMDRINELRRIPAHKTAARNYKPGDLEVIDWVYDHLTGQAGSATQPQ